MRVVEPEGKLTNAMRKIRQASPTVFSAISANPQRSQRFKICTLTARTSRKTAEIAEPRSLPIIFAPCAFLYVQGSGHAK